MATGDPFYYFSSEGAYNMASANTQAVTGTSTTTTYGGLGLIGGLNYGGNVAGLANQFHTTVQVVPQPSSLSEYMAQACKPAQAAKKKLKGILANLRSEIDDWHGDILERCPA